MTTSSEAPASSQAPAPRVFPGFGQAMLLVFFIWLAIGFVAVAATVVQSVRAGRVEMPSEAVLLLVANTAGFFLITAFGWRYTGARLGEVFPLRRVRFSLFAPVFLVALGGVAVLSQVDSLIRLLPAPEWWNSLLRAIDETMVSMIREAYWPALIALVVMAPVTEELFFRGLVLRGFRLRYPRGKAIVLSALLFAIAHLTPNQLLSAFAIGLFLGWIVFETESLWLALFTHAVANGVAWLSVGATAPASPGAGQPDLLPWWTTLAGLLLLAAGGWWLLRLLRLRSPAL